MFVSFPLQRCFNKVSFSTLALFVFTSLGFLSTEKITFQHKKFKHSERSIRVKLHLRPVAQKISVLRYHLSEDEYIAVICLSIKPMQGKLLRKECQIGLLAFCLKFVTKAKVDFDPFEMLINNVVYMVARLINFY